MMKLSNRVIALRGSRYFFTQVRFAGRYYRAMGGEDCPIRGAWIR